MCVWWVRHGVGIFWRGLGKGKLLYDRLEDCRVRRRGGGSDFYAGYLPGAFYLESPLPSYSLNFPQTSYLISLDKHSLASSLKAKY